MVNWIRDLSAKERKTLLAAYGGWSVDAFDFMIYTFVIPTLIAAWGMTRGEAGMIATSALLASAVGGWAAGALADRVGRVRMLQITIAWFALFTFLCGFTHSFEQLLIVRTLQGLGFGGEWAVGSVIIGEIIRAEHRGKAVGTVQSGWAIGWGGAALLFTVFFSVLPEELAWRVLFWVGLLPALLILYIRRNVAEPEVFEATRSHREARGGSFLEIFSARLLPTTVLASLVATGMQGGYYAITTWLPTYLKTVRGLSVLDTGGYLIVVIAGALAGYLVAAWLSDRIGRRNTFFLFAVCSAASAVIYTLLPISDALMLVLGFPLGFFVSGNFSGVGAFFTELFPSRCRGSGQGFCYNFGRGIGALFPALVGFLSAKLGLGAAIGLFAGAAYVLVILAVALLPETRGKTLAVYD
ncbi:MAG TPA: MFS transporter [Burkholderiales bacterium]|jgi:MFS family permease|nr:MFS transporter [Burkholderiales bacterium]